MSRIESRASAGASERPCGICGLIDRCRRREFPDFVAELPNSFVILGDAQFYRGYCVVLARTHVNEVHLMPSEEAHALFEETVAVGRAIAAATDPLKINYECLGNVEPHVHWHVFPRFKTDQMSTAPVWLRPEVERKVSLEDTNRRALVRAIGEHLESQIPGAVLAKAQ